MDYDEDQEFVPGVTTDSSKMHFNMDMAVQETLLKIMQHSAQQAMNGNHHMRFRALKQVKIILQSKFKGNEVEDQNLKQSLCQQLLISFNRLKVDHGIEYDESSGYSLDILNKPLWKRDNKIPTEFYIMEMDLEKSLDSWAESLWCIMTRLGLCFIGQKKYDIGGM